MKTKIRLPKSLRPACDLRSRESIISYLSTCADSTQRGGPDYDAQCSRGPWQFCWNVKLLFPGNPLDFSFSRFFALHRGELGSREVSWLAQARQRHADMMAGDDDDQLCEMACESAREQWQTGTAILYDGTEIPAQVDFVGRSGGWLVLAAFHGESMTCEVFREVICGGTVDNPGWLIEELRQLAEYCHRITLATRDGALKTEIERQAAFHFFENVCADIKDSKQLAAQNTALAAL